MREVADVRKNKGEASKSRSPAPFSRAEQSKLFFIIASNWVKTRRCD